MSAIGFVRKALAMGVDLETALKMGEAFEAESPAAPVLSDAIARKRQYDRERMAEKRAQEQRRRNDTNDVARLATTPATTDDVAASPVHTRGENNLSRLVDTSSAAVVVAEAREPGFDWPKGKAADHAKLLVELTANRCLDPSRQQLLVTTTGRLEAWRRDGASWEHDVVPVVTTIARARGSPIKSWKFFDDAIAQSIADNRRALQIPTAANGHRHERPDQPSRKLTAKLQNMASAERGLEIALARRQV